MNYLVTILCVTYNHEKYIDDAVRGFLSQKTSFPVKILIGDDASTDSTPQLLDKYSDIDNIEIIKRSENIGVTRNFKDLSERIHTKYVALCEGDDYWTDPLKLQKQVDFMEGHPKVTVCFHPSKVVNLDGTESVYPEPGRDNDYYNEANLKKTNFMDTASVVYRWKYHEFKHLLPDDFLPLDWIFHLMHAQYGEVTMLPDIMSVYRRNPGGVWSSLYSRSWYERFGRAHLNYINFRIRYFDEIPYAYLYFNELAYAYVMNDKRSSCLKYFRFVYWLRYPWVGRLCSYLCHIVYKVWPFHRLKLWCKHMAWALAECARVIPKL